LSQTTSFVGSQPIFDAQRRVVAYELLFRNSELNRAEISDPDKACADTLLSAVTDIGLDNLVGDARGFVNLTEGVLFGPLLEGLPRDRITLEILEDVPATPRVIERLRALRAMGFQIALDDFVINEQTQPLVELADIIKVDVLALGAEGAAQAAKLLQRPKIQLLAEKVETQDIFDAMKAAGYSLFQGYFFCKPKVLKTHKLSPGRANTMRLLAMLNDPDADLRKVEDVIRADVALSYRVMRAANSSHTFRARPVDSVRSAITLLGIATVRTLASLLALSDAGESSTELLLVSMIRARMCELMAGRAHYPSSVAFTVGLFSLLDVMMCVPMETIVQQLPAMPDVTRALLDRAGVPGGFLSEIEAYERGLAAGVEDPSPELSPVRLEALRWAHAALRTLIAPRDHAAA
jgi:EAL and modified HD-GYP domain-containing signal transduction protein